METFTHYKFIKDCLAPHKLGISLMFLVAVTWAAHVSFTPYIVKILLDRAVYSRNFQYLLLPAMWLLVAQFVMWTMIRLYDYFVSYKMIPDLRRSLVQKSINYVEAHSYSFFQNHLSASIAGRLDDLTRVVPDLIYIIIDRFFSHLLALIIAISVLWLILPFFALALGAWIIVFGLVHYYLFSPRIIEACELWNYAEAETKGSYNDFFTNILSIKIFSSFKKETYLQNLLLNVVKKEQKFKKAVLLSYIFYGYSFFIYQVVCLYFLLKNYSAGFLTGGDFAFIIMINIQFADYIWQLTNDTLRFAQYQGAYKQAFLYLTVPHEIKDKPGAANLSVQEGMIEFKDVWFKYDNSDFIFKGKKVKISPGQKVGLVGCSGAGKSTFVNLVLRLFEVHKGDILIDGNDIRNVTQESLRNAIGFIPQEPTLFHRTILDNISYGNLNACKEEIIDAAKKAHAHDFIMHLPDGYDTVIGERGVKLSGGQRQRLAIARVFLKNAPILILDEPTSQLDAITEHSIQNALYELMKGKTTLVIAHRLSTLTFMDRILVFNKGEIIQDGTHVVLKEEEGLYQELLSKCILNESVLQRKASLKSFEYNTVKFQVGN